MTGFFLDTFTAWEPHPRLVGEQGRLAIDSKHSRENFFVQDDDPPQSSTASEENAQLVVSQRLRKGTREVAAHLAAKGKRPQVV